MIANFFSPDHFRQLRKWLLENRVTVDGGWDLEFPVFSWCDFDNCLHACAITHAHTRDVGSDNRQQEKLCAKRIAIDDNKEVRLGRSQFTAPKIEHTPSS